jgi:Na+/H+ antiporter NhaD/arsenite permease-like protein
MLSINFYHIMIICTFVTGYFFIAIEHITKINKTSIALLMAILCWVFQFLNQTESSEENLLYLGQHLSHVSQIVFFLLGALTIVEIISAHKGFTLLSRHIHIHSKRVLLWVIGISSFFLSAILDNLTTTIIIITLLQKLVIHREDRLFIGGAVVIAANAGGVWTPIGDVTTTMLWVGGQLSTVSMMSSLFIPSILCLIASLACLTYFLKGNLLIISQNEDEKLEPRGVLVFWLGLGSLIFVPIFKVWTGLPPFMGVLLGLSFLWLCLDFIHSGYANRDHLRVPHIMTHVDMTNVLFFLGILLCIDALHTAGLLQALASWLTHMVPHANDIAIIIGLASAVIDNVPLVAAVMNMYDLAHFPPNSEFWNMIAYCAGTGGSILVIGSAAGIAFMGLEKVDFFWYARRIGLAAFVGYIAGMAGFFL